MTVTTPTPRRRYVPDRPPGGYHVQPEPDITTDLADLDHVAEIRRALDEIRAIDDLLAKLERRRDSLTARLDDPQLLIDIPPDDSRRIEAEDRLSAIDATWSASVAQLGFWAGMVITHGMYLVRDDETGSLDAIGRELTHGFGALGRVQSDCPGVLTSFPWQRLVNAACPF